MLLEVALTGMFQPEQFTNEGVEIMKRAFTLIELLVVIAIIAILAAILFPVFAQAKVAAKKTADLSNQKQIATSTFLYSSDADDYYPRSVYLTQAGNCGSQFVMRQAIDPYTKSGANGTDAYAGSGGLWISPGQPMAPGGKGAGYLLHGRLAPVDVDWGTCTNRTDTLASVSQTQIDNIASKMLMTSVGTPFGGFPASSMMHGWWFWSGEMGRYNPTTKTCDNLYSTWPPLITGGQAGFRCYNADGPDSIGGRDWLSGSMIRFRFNDGASMGFTDGHAKYKTAPQYNWCTDVAIGGISRWDSNDPASDDYDAARVFRPGSVCGNYIGQQ